MQSLESALNSMTVDELKELLVFLPLELGGSRKAEIIQRIVNGLDGVEKLMQQYDDLDELQQLAVAEALHDPLNALTIDEFQAKYQRTLTLRERPSGHRVSYYGAPTRLSLFLFAPLSPHAGRATLELVSDFIQPLLTFVHKPQAAKLRTQHQLPEKTSDELKLEVRLCEREVMIDLPQVLNLLQQGKLKASAKTGRASAATIKLLAGVLSGGDFYALERPKQYSFSQEIGGIKAFSWPLLLQAANLAQIEGSKMALKKNGVRQLVKPAAETVRLLWVKWQKTKLIDEFSRVEQIKGQGSNRGRTMTAVAPRRMAVNNALKQCPVGEWVAIDEFINFMQAAKHHFEVTNDLWRLYLVDSEYGSFGYSGFHAWNVLQGRYILSILFEYAATLGMVDVAYTDPEYARDDFRGNWGTDDIEFLSRYDGLRYFRLTALGAYCLGLTEDYDAPSRVSSCTFSVSAQLRVALTSGTLTGEDQIVLNTWCKAEDHNFWKLDRATAMLAIERGFDIDSLQSFLQGEDDQFLPETVESFIHSCKEHGGAIKHVAVCILLECSSEKVAATLAEHKESRHLCQRVGKKQLLVKQNQNDKFQQAARVIGYGMQLSTPK